MCNGFGHKVACHSMLQYMHELNPRESGAHNRFDDLRLSQSREILATRSKDIAVVDDQHRRVRIAVDAKRRPHPSPKHPTLARI